MTNSINTSKRIVADSMLQSIGEEAADSRILSGYEGPMDAEAIARAKTAGYTLAELCPSGEFAIDLMGESGKNGGFTAPNGDFYTLASSYKVASGEACAALHLDVNGSPRRAAAQLNLINIKPTVGTVSCYGCIPVCRSSDTVSVTARTVSEVKELLSAISGRDEKDPLTEGIKFSESSKPTVARVGLALFDKAPWLKEKRSDPSDVFNAIGVETAEITETFDINRLFTIAHSAWNTVLCSELCGNLSRYDGVHFGRRAENVTDLNELYIRSRSEGFGKLVKAAIIYGSHAMTGNENGSPYTKAVSARTFAKEMLNGVFETVDAIVTPVCSAPEYTVKDAENGRFTAFKENFYTALPSRLGLPTVTVSGVQIIGKPYSDNALTELAEKLEVNGK